MTAITKPFRNQKPALSDGPRPLTQQEIEFLRKSRQEDHQWFQEAIKKYNLKPL